MSEEEKKIDPVDQGEKVNPVCRGERTNIRAKVFVGNPGVGKSTMLNGMGRSLEFPSGVSFGTGRTTHLNVLFRKEEGDLLVDTPGLEDIEFL